MGFKRFLPFRALGLLALLTYLSGTVLGGVTHNILHHFEEAKHHHSAQCLEKVLLEAASDDGVDSAPPFAAYSAPSCFFKIAFEKIARTPVSASIPFIAETPVFNSFESTFAETAPLFGSHAVSLPFSTGPPSDLI
jgi:hypothetical protein